MMVLAGIENTYHASSSSSRRPGLPSAAASLSSLPPPPSPSRPPPPAFRKLPAHRPPRGPSLPRSPSPSSSPAMDYDRYDAFLHHIFKQTQGDAWFRPNEDNIAVGVALRVDNGEYRVFPYENLGLEPFEAACRVLNPAVAVKIRSAAVHAAFSEVYVRLPYRVRRVAGR